MLIDCNIGVVRIDCPIDRQYCIADAVTPCEYFGSVILTSGGYFAVACNHNDKVNELMDLLTEFAGYIMEQTDTGAYYHTGDVNLNMIAAKINGALGTPWSAGCEG